MHDRTDRQIMNMEEESARGTNYRRYMQDRFEILENDGECVVVADKEMGQTMELHEGDSLADGKIGGITEDGVIFEPPRAEVESFTLSSVEEMMPMAMEKSFRNRMKLEDDLTQSNGVVLIISQDPYSDMV